MKKSVISVIKQLKHHFNIDAFRPSSTYMQLLQTVCPSCMTIWSIHSFFLNNVMRRKYTSLLLCDPRCDQDVIIPYASSSLALSVPLLDVTLNLRHEFIDIQINFL